MNKQVMVIGLGQFGMALSQALSDRGAEVLAVDHSIERVNHAAVFCAEALCFDATEEMALVRTAPERRDACVCAIGDESRESSIICTALLRQAGAPRVIARATDPMHARILRLVGAHDVVDPEHAYGGHLANLVIHEGLVGELPLSGDLVITELRAPASFFGRTLAELALPKRFGVTVAAVRVEGQPSQVPPDPMAPLLPQAVLVVVSRSGAVPDMLRKV